MPATMIGRGLHPLLPRPVPDPRPAPIISADRDGQGHRDHGAPPPGAHPRAPTQCASPIALWIGRSSPPSRGCCRDGAGDPRVALVGRPCPTSSSSSSSGSPERTGAGAVSASRASFEALEIPRTKRRRPTLNAFSAIEVLVPYTSLAATPHASEGRWRALEVARIGANRD